MPQPFNDRKGAADNAQKYEHDHGPLEWRRFCDTKYSRTESNRKASQNQESDRATGCHDRQHPISGIVQSAIGRNDHGERKGGRRKTRHHERASALFADFSFQLFKTSFSCHFPDTLLTQLSCHQVEQENADCAAAHGRSHIQQISFVIARHHAHNQKIVSERQEKKRSIQNPEQKRAEIAQVDQEAEQMTEKG